MKSQAVEELFEMSSENVERVCGCKGIRTCLLCEDAAKKDDVQKTNLVIYKFCPSCGDKAWRDGLSMSHELHINESEQKEEIGHESNSSNATKYFIYIQGVYVVNESITLEQEQYLCEQIDLAAWTESQSGRRKQDFGPKVNFKKKKCKIGLFRGLPGYIRNTFESLKSNHGQILTDFHPVEMCNLEYVPERGSSIDAHLDDAWLWGSRLVTLNYLSSTVLTLSRPDGDKMSGDDEEVVEIAIEMAPRSLLVLYGEARYDWLHSIKRNDIQSRRLATTLRELTPQFLPGGKDEIIGEQLLLVADNDI